MFHVFRIQQIIKNVLLVDKYLLMHFPSEQISGDGHLSSLPHLHCRFIHVSAASDASEQSSFVLHSSVIRVCYSYFYTPVIFRIYCYRIWFYDVLTGITHSTWIWARILYIFVWFADWSIWRTVGKGIFAFANHARLRTQFFEGWDFTAVCICYARSFLISTIQT